MGFDRSQGAVVAVLQRLLAGRKKKRELLIHVRCVPPGGAVELIRLQVALYRRLGQVVRLISSQVLHVEFA
ncbi:MAG: hypothetical protein ABI782_02560, partial [Anaerolineaceae bacterium]